MMLLNLTLICLVCVVIIDLSGFMQSLKRFISNVLTKRKVTTTDFSLKPFDCSFCMTFWCCILYTIVNGEFTLIHLGYICLLAFMTDTIRQFLLLIKDMFNKLIDTIYGLYIDKAR